MLKPNRLLISLLPILFFSSLWGNVDVLVTKQIIKFKESITPDHVISRKVKKVRRNCTPMTLQQLTDNPYITTHYMNRGSIVCEKDVKLYQKETVLFKFGHIEIEKEGKIVGQTNDYIRIKQPNGRIEKISKRGISE